MRFFVGVIATCLLAATCAWANEEPLAEARNVQGKIDGLSDEMMHKLNEIEKEYNLKKTPLIQQRNQELRKAKRFWQRVIENHPSHTGWFRDSDKELLPFLSDISVEEDEAGAHKFTIKVRFDANPYFSDAELWRKIEGVAEEESSEASGIHWMEGKRPEGVSFFNFFEKRIDGDFLEGHFLNDIAHVFRYEFWPNPFTYHDIPTMEEFANEHYIHQEEGEVIEAPQTDDYEMQSNQDGDADIPTESPEGTEDVQQPTEDEPLEEEAAPSQEQ